MTRARAVAAALTAEFPSEPALIAGAWKQILAREPKAEETARSIAFLNAQSQNTGGRREAVVELVRALLNLNEFLYVD